MKKVLSALCAILLVWVCASYIEVYTQSASLEEREYSSWNIIVILTDWAKGVHTK